MSAWEQASLFDDLDPLETDTKAARAAAEHGMDQALHADRVQMWKLAADAWLAQQPSGLIFRADHLIEAIGLPDQPGERERPNNVVGAWFSAKSQAGLIVWTGRFGRSARIVGHSNPQRIWRKV